MAYVRISLMQPKRGQEERVGQLLDDLIEFYEKQPGYITGYRLRPHDGSNRVGRIGIWEHQDDAERAATDGHDMALRSELNMVVEDGSHQELSFDGELARKVSQ